MVSTLEDFYKVLFNDDEFGCFGDLYSKEVTKPLKAPVEFFCVNPLSHEQDYDFEKSNLYRKDLPRRANLNVTSFRNFVFEMDSVSLEDQLRIIEECGISFSAVTYSGGKSYHCVLSLEKPLDVPVHTSLGVALYKAEWRRLGAKIEDTAKRLFPDKYKVILDYSMQNPSRLTRCPFYVRNTGKEQKLLRLGKRMSEEEYLTLLNSCPVIETSNYAASYELDFGIDKESDFWYYAPIGLQNLIKYPTWVSDTNMYPRMFKLALWAIDSTGISYELFVKIVEKSIFTEFEKVGYPKHKYFLGINSAFGYRRTRGKKS